MDELVFYTHPMSRGRTARWMLEEVGAPYRTEIVKYGPEMKAAAYLAINPMGKVPALVHGGATVTEAAAIVAYLADAFPEAGLAPPPADPRRGAYLRWLFFTAGPLEAAVVNKALGFELKTDRDRGMAGYGSLELALDTVEKAVATGFVGGEGFTAADLYLGSMLNWVINFKIIETRPAFDAYWARMANRPAFLRAKQTDDALLAEPGMMPG